MYVLSINNTYLNSRVCDDGLYNTYLTLYMHCFMCPLAIAITPKANCRFREISCSHRNCAKFNKTKGSQKFSSWQFYVPPRKLWYTELKIDYNRFISFWITTTEKEESLSNMKSEHKYVHTNACISQVEFYVMWLCIVTNFVVIKPTTYTNFTNLFCHETLHVSESSFVHHREFICCTLSNDIYHCWVYSE